MRGLLYGYGGKAKGGWGYFQNGDLETTAAVLRYIDDPFSQDDTEYLNTPYTAIISGCRRCITNDKPTEVFYIPFASSSRESTQCQRSSQPAKATCITYPL